MTTPETILIRVSGDDKPGVTSGLLTLLAELGAEIQDMEQVVVQRQLTFCLLYTSDAADDTLW